MSKTEFLSRVGLIIKKQNNGLVTSAHGNSGVRGNTRWGTCPSIYRNFLNLLQKFVEFSVLIYLFLRRNSKQYKTIKPGYVEARKGS